VSDVVIALQFHRITIYMKPLVLLATLAAMFLACSSTTMTMPPPTEESLADSGETSPEITDDEDSSMTSTSSTAEPAPESAASTASKLAPEEAIVTLVNTFFSHAKNEDIDAVRTTHMMPIWIDTDVLHESARTVWAEEWAGFIGHMSRVKVANVKVFAIPDSSEWSDRAKGTFRHFAEQNSQKLYGADVTFEGGGPGVAFICSETVDGWKIVGIDDNLIERLFRQ
jgi:hypothetical protein